MVAALGNQGQQGGFDVRVSGLRHRLNKSTGDFNNHFNLNTSTHGQLRDAKGASGVCAHDRAKHLAQQLAGTVGDQMLVGKVGG